jgi:hypothetical protein
MFFRSKRKTRIVVNFDAGFQNTLYVRGEGIPNLTWEKGIPLKNVKKDEWIIELDAPFKAGQFKVLINDQTFEAGSNHPIAAGSSVRVKPRF